MSQISDDYFQGILEATDLLPKQQVIGMQKTVLNSEFPWNFVREITAPYQSWRDNDLYKQPYVDSPFSVHGFVHELWSQGKVVSKHYDQFLPVVYALEDAADLEIEDLVEFRLNLFTKNVNNVPYHIQHIDISKPGKMYSAIFYICESDGNTHFFEEFFDPDVKRFIDGYRPDLFNVVKTVPPEQGKAILFDSRRYHASAYPERHPERVVLNMTFKVK